MAEVFSEDRALSGSRWNAENFKGKPMPLSSWAHVPQGVLERRVATNSAGYIPYTPVVGFW